jgi:hypothetical protein
MKKSGLVITPTIGRGNANMQTRAAWKVDIKTK